MASYQYVYHMQGLSKTYAGGKKVLDNIHLSFYPDAKIGVLGVNGSGKSTLLRIMAGLDKDFVGDGFVAEGARVGYLPQEPHLDEAKTVRENVMIGVAPQQAILDRYNELAMNYSDEAADAMTRLQDEIDAKGLWDLDSKIDQAIDRIENGTYGYCEESGEPIGLRRLEARPIATMSIEAQERHERMERVHRDD